MVCHFLNVQDVWRSAKHLLLFPQTSRRWRNILVIDFCVRSRKMVNPREMTNRLVDAVVAVVHHLKLSLRADIIIRIQNIYLNSLAMTSCLGSRLDVSHANKMLLSCTDKNAIPTPFREMLDSWNGH